MSILKSTNSGKFYTFISKENLLRLGWIREKNHEGRDLFYEPGSYHTYYDKSHRFLEYKSMETPKWYLNVKGQEGYYEEGFYIDLFGIEYLVKTKDDLNLCDSFWNTYNRLDINKAAEERYFLKDQILISNDWNIQRYDPKLNYYKSKHGDVKHNS